MIGRIYESDCPRELCRRLSSADLRRTVLHCLQVVQGGRALAMHPHRGVRAGRGGAGAAFAVGGGVARPLWPGGGRVPGRTDVDRVVAMCAQAHAAAVWEGVGLMGFDAGTYIESLAALSEVQLWDEAESVGIFSPWRDDPRDDEIGPGPHKWRHCWQEWKRRYGDGPEAVGRWTACLVRGMQRYAQLGSKIGKEG